MFRLSEVPVLIFLSLPLTSACRAEKIVGVVSDWSALGSGCRGRQGMDGGNVSFSLKAPGYSPPNRSQMRFVMEKFKLESPVPKEQGRTNLEFARDCAIRIAIKPPKGKRVRYVEAQTGFEFSKPQNSEMAAFAQLTLGLDTLSNVQMDFKKDELITRIEKPLRLAPGRFVENGMPETKCGQSKLLGLDLLFYVKRPDDSAKINMGLTGEKAVDVVVELVDCES